LIKSALAWPQQRLKASWVCTPASRHVQHGSDIRPIMSYFGVSDGKAQRGSLRCDLNISMRRGMDAPFGVKVELKSMNSFSAIRRPYEQDRQGDPELANQILKPKLKGGGSSTDPASVLREPGSVVRWNQAYKAWVGSDRLVVTGCWRSVAIRRSGSSERPRAAHRLVPGQAARPPAVRR
jgi:hypothetical protein